MANTNKVLHELVESVLSQPTAPFRESWTKRACQSFCAEHKLKTFEDDVGNLWVGVDSLREARAARMVAVAHLDHPGIVVERFERQSDRSLFAYGRWLGGGPMNILGHEVRLFADVSTLVTLEGQIVHATYSKFGADKVKIRIKPSPLALASVTARGFRALAPWGACLWYSKQGLKQGLLLRQGEWHTKAADDLVGACALLDAYRRAGKPKGVALILTRAEESGFHGALAVLESKILNPKKTVMLSIETSSYRAGAPLSAGPVVRLGDRMSVFDSALVAWLQSAATAAGVKFQRKVMDGGSCEASAFALYGFRVAGFSTPLGNYHNISGSGSSRPEPEYVNVHDVEGLTAILTRVFEQKLPSKWATLDRAVFKPVRERLIKNQRAHRKYF